MAFNTKVAPVSTLRQRVPLTGGGIGATPKSVVWGSIARRIGGGLFGTAVPLRAAPAPAPVAHPVQHVDFKL